MARCFLTRDEQKTKKLPSLRGRIIALGFGTTVGFMALCVGLLLVLVFSVLGDHTLRTADFALKEVSGNLTAKTTLLADVLLNVRRDDLLMEALKGEGLLRDVNGKSPTEDRFRHAVDIYSNKNTDKLDGPFLDAVYLFDANGVFNKTSYTEHLYHLQIAIDEQYMGLYRGFIKTDADVAVISGEGLVHILYTLYDNAISPSGTLIFSVRKDSVRQLMEKMDDYPESFWILYDKHGTRLLQNGKIPLDDADIHQLITQPPLIPLQQSFPTGKYRVYTEGSTMGIGAILGLSANQLQLLLFRSVSAYMVGIFAALILVGSLIFWITARLTKPLPEMASKLQQVTKGQFDTKLPAYTSQEFNTISATFNSMTETINHLVHDVYEKKLMVMDSEMKFLQSQMNPHFMYNVLNTIALQAKIDGNEEVHKMAANFAALTQARLSPHGDSVIPLWQELQYVRFYLELQKSRFGDKLKYDIEVEDEALLQCVIPKLTVELIAENAVLHGIEPKDSPGQVVIRVCEADGDLCITVEDDGVGFENGGGEISLPLPDTRVISDERHNHIALNNAQKLIQHHFGEHYGIHITSYATQGSTVVITIPRQSTKEGDNVSHHHR